MANGSMSALESAVGHGAGRGGTAVHVCSLTDSAWDAFVMEHPEGTFVHQLGFGRIVADVFGYHPYYLVLRRGGEIRGVLPLFLVPSGLRRRSLISLPCSDWGAVVAEDADGEAALLQAAREWAEGVGADLIEFRSRKPLPVGPPASLEKVNLRLRLTTAERIWGQMRGETRNQVRQAERRGLQVEVGGVNLVAPFYQIWSTNMRDLGTPVYPRSFFARLVADFSEDAGVFLVRRNTRAVGGAIFTIFRDEMTMPFGSSLRSEFQGRPNNLLLWRAIQEACERRLAWISFGWSSRGSGTYRFKKSWGSEEEQLYVQVIPLRNNARPPRPTHPAYRLATAGWSRLPLSVANWLGPAFARRFVY